MEVEKLGREPAPTWDTSPLTWGISLLSHSAGPKDITLTHFFHLFEKQRDSKREGKGEWARHLPSVGLFPTDPLRLGQLTHRPRTSPGSPV